MNSGEARVNVGVIFYSRTNKVKPTFYDIHDYRYDILDILDEIQCGTLKRCGSGVRYHVLSAYRNEDRCRSYLFRFGDIWYLSEYDNGIPDIQTCYSGFNYSGRKIIDVRYDNPYKASVDVEAIFNMSGRVKPAAFWWEDGTFYDIDFVGVGERAASLKAGIIGQRYPIRVRGRETFLFRDDDLWFMERKGNHRILDVHGREVV